MADLITASGGQASIIYEVPGGQSFRLLCVSFVTDGTALAADYVPTLELDGQDGTQIGLFGQDLLVKTGGAPLITFAPNIGSGPHPVPATTVYCQTAIPDLIVEPLYTLAFYGRTGANAGPDPSIVTRDLALYVEPLEGGAAGLAFGPFMLVPGPGA